MKRRGTGPDREPDKKKSAAPRVGIAERMRSATRTTSFRFPDEVLKIIYSFLCVKDRQVTRRVNRNVLKFVDESTPGAKKLFLDVYEDGWETQLYSGPQDNHLDSVEFHITLAGQDAGGRWDNLDANTCKILLSRCLSLRSIRPKAFELQIHSTCLQEADCLKEQCNI